MRTESVKLAHRSNVKVFMNDAEKLREWCEKNGCTLKLANNNLHWQIRGKIYADFFPSTHKLCFNENWNNIIYVFFFVEFLDLLTSKLPKTSKGQK